MQNGVRYLLPAFPFAILWLARAWPAADRAFGRRGRLLVAGLVLMGTLESLRVHPHHLMFFNVWAGGPEGGPRYLVQGDDWGQDQRRVGEWQARRGLRWIYYARYGGQPGHWGIQFLPMPCEPTAGQYALHAVEVHRPWRLEPGCLDWLTVEAPDERLGYSVYIYDVDRARLARLQRERGHVKPFWQSGARGSSDDQVAPESTDRPR